MTAEQQGVSPATAGGASASKLCFALVGQNGRGLAIRCDLPWGHPGAHHGVAGIDYGLTARATIPEPFRRMFWVAAEDIANVIGCTVVEGEARGYDETDPRDAEIDRLTRDLRACEIKRNDFRSERDEARAGWKRADAEVTRLARCYDAVTARADSVEAERDEARAELERIAAFVGGSAAMPGSVRSAVEHAFSQRDKKRDAEIERLRVQFDGIRGALRAANILIEGARSERDQLRAEVDELEQISFTAYAELLNPIKKVFGESPVGASHYRELREGIDGLIGKVEHWRGLAETRGAQVEHFAHTIRELTAERDRLRAELDGQRADKEQAEAAHDRLRQELDRVGEQPPKFRDGQRVRIGRHFGTVEKPKDVTRVRLDGMAPSALFETRLVNAIEDKPAEPRRWRVGDPEPEIGTTVWRRAERYRRSSNGWHHVGDFTGYGSWAWILSVGSEVVEAVDRG